MYLSGKITVMSVIPEKLSRLKDVAHNLWWSWNSEAIDLYREIDLSLWEKLGKNPVRFMQEVSLKSLQKKLNDSGYMSRYAEIIKKFDTYISNENTWFKKHYPEKCNHLTAYFSAEYGLNEVLPVYSGGLGILSGDHCKSASDLGIPFTAIGLFYKQGYFSQRINRDGWQETKYTALNTSYLPIKPVLNEKGEQLYINLELSGRVVYARIWVVSIGRVSMYLMDTDVEQNSSTDRIITARLYGGDQETRIQQEIFLGIGGIRVLDALGIKPSVYHMNEGHSAFMGLELIRKFVQEKHLSFREAIEAAASCMVFTTHTPVPAGNDVFPLHMIDKYFSSYWGLLGISRHEFLDLGMRIGDHQNFNMTILALTISGRKNGVSALHGAVSRSIYNNLWPGIPEDEVPITHITNGIHTLTWLSPTIKNIYNQYLDREWQDNLYKAEIWAGVNTIPDIELWNAHCMLKNKMIKFIRARLREQRIYNNESPERIRETDSILNENALTIAFARRFATYKRANLIFRDCARIQKILNNPKMPVQLIFAGKAHPADRPAHEVIKNINDIASQEGFFGKVVLLENYNMTLARNLVQGSDIWLNNPRRPLEASGTSGQKVAINGIVNFSILDGWWCEGYNGTNGWAIGDETFYGDENYADIADSESIYDILEEHIIPLFFDRNGEGIPVRWVNVMKESIKSLTCKFSTHRMLMEYIEKMYIPCIERYEKIVANNYESASKLSAWKTYVEKNWPQVQIIADKTMNELKEYKAKANEIMTVSTLVNLGLVNPSDVKVELYHGCKAWNNLIENPVITEMNLVEKTENGLFRYYANISFPEGGEYYYTIRIVPENPDLINRFDPGLIRWAVN